MIKRKLAILLFTVSGILLMAHSIIPHHHHGSTVCFNHSHCIPQNTSHEQGSTGHSHDNKTPDSEEYCILNQVYLAPTNQVRTELSQLTSPDDFSGVFDSFNAIVPGDIRVLLPNRNIDCGQPPFRNYFPRLASSDLSLRAPPVV